jgi:hypothetical protein
MHYAPGDLYCKSHEPKCLLSPPAAEYSYTEHLEELEGERLEMFLEATQWNTPRQRVGKALTCKPLTSTQ